VQLHGADRCCGVVAVDVDVSNDAVNVPIVAEVACERRLRRRGDDDVNDDDSDDDAGNNAVSSLPLLSSIARSSIWFEVSVT